MVKQQRLPFVSARPRGLWARRALWVLVVVHGVVLMLGFAHLLLLGLWWAGVSISDELWSVHEVSRIVVDYIGLLVVLFIALFFLLWFQWTYRNLYALGARDLEYSTNWAVGGFFVPIGNILFPYVVAKEVWIKSDPNVGAESPPRVPVRLRLWWISFLAIGIGNYMLERYQESMGGTLREWVIVTIYDMGTSGVTIIASVLALWLIEELNTRQEQRNLHLTAGTAVVI